MKSFTTLALIILAVLSAQAQNKSVGIGIVSPNTNAALHVVSPTGNQGLLIPQLTTTQRNSMALATADKGMLVFDTNQNALYVWNGSAWGLDGVSNTATPAVTGTNTSSSGTAGSFTINNAGSTASAVYGTTNGLGNAGSFVSSNVTGNSPALYARADGNATVGQFESFSGTNNKPTFTSTNFGLSNAGSFAIVNPSNSTPSLVSSTNGTGSAGNFTITNTANTAPVITITHANPTNPIAINTTANIQAGKFIGDGSLLTNLAGGGLTYPYTSTYSGTPILGGATSLFELKYNNAAPAKVMRVENMSMANNSTAFEVVTNGTGLAGSFQVNNSSNGNGALLVSTNSSAGLAPAFSALSTGTANSAGVFKITIASNAGSTLYSETSGTGLAGEFVNLNGASASPAFQARTNGTGSAISGVSTSSGSDVTGFFSQQSTTNTKSAIYGENSGDGPSATFNNKKAASSAPVVNIVNAGTGNAITAVGTIQATKFQGDGSLLTNLPAISLPMVASSGTAANALDITNSNSSASGGSAGKFAISNSNNNSAALDVVTAGGGSAGRFITTSTSNPAPALLADSQGAGSALKGTSSNGKGYAGVEGIGTAGTGAGYGVVGTTSSANGGTSAIYGQNTGGGPAGNFTINNVSNASYALIGMTSGSGSAGNFQITNASSTAPVLNITHNNPSVNSVAINTTANIQAGKFIGDASLLTNVTASKIAYPYSETISTNPGASLFELKYNNAATTNVMNVESNVFTSSATTLRVYNEGLGMGGSFILSNGANTTAALYAEMSGTGDAFLVRHYGSSGNLATFKNINTNVARIDKTGAFFGSVYNTSGADVAEMFDIEGARNSYEPGDVLVISENTDRTMEKSNEPNSTKVAGVYATKPGVTLTEKGIDENLDDMVPLGVMGVIPTKVCGENGPIRRGDLLVTSSTSGHAMKAISKNGDGVYPSGVILGKALENFDGNGKGLIKVLVNVK